MAATEFSKQPKNVKIITVVIMVLIFGYFGIKLINANKQDNLENPTTLQGGKEYVDYKVKELKGRYDAICKGVRNDQVKADLKTLMLDLQALNEYGSKIKEISYEDQIAVNNYANERIKSDKDLYDLMTTATCNCW